MSYLDEMGRRIYRVVEPDGALGPHDALLYRIYAVLALAKGEGVTAEDVHNAWAAWATVDRPWHASLRPFADLSPEVQALDEPYVDAIRRVAASMLVP